MSNRCPECGQMMGSDRELCERCEKAQRMEALEARVEELEEKAAVFDRLLELLRLGLSPAQALDVVMCVSEERLYSPPEWAEIRRVSPAAVYNNIADSRPKWEHQTELSEHLPLPEEYTPEIDVPTETELPSDLGHQDTGYFK